MSLLMLSCCGGMRDCPNMLCPIVTWCETASHFELEHSASTRYGCIRQQCSQAGHVSRKGTEELVCCRDQVPYQKVYTALSVIELEFDWTLTNFAYQAVLKVCAKDMSEPAARMALRILDGLRVRCYPLLPVCSNEA